jgi:maleylpyruvate isomerase
MPRTVLAELGDAESRVLDHLESVGNEKWAADPSGLPDWTRGHVVGHLAGNAEGLQNLVTWVETGEITPMYPSREARAAEIERRSQLPWTDLLDEFRSLSADLTSRLEAAEGPLKVREVTLGSGSGVEAWELPAVRMREVEIHHVDLADGYRATDWPDTFVLRTLSRLTPFFESRRDVPISTMRATDTGRAWSVGSGPDLLGTEADLLAWLLGRAHDPVRSSDGSPPPTAPRWV